MHVRHNLTCTPLKLEGLSAKRDTLAVDTTLKLATCKAASVESEPETANHIRRRTTYKAITIDRTGNLTALHNRHVRT